jgi:hypothetical protein
VKVVRTENDAPDGVPLTAESAKEAIRRRGHYRVALVISRGYGESPNRLVRPDKHRGVVMFYDELEPVEAQIVGGLLQMAAGRRAFTGLFQFGKDSAETTGGASEDARMLVKVDRQSVRVRRMKNAAKHTFLAGLVPMFLLFSAAGAARGILESLKNGETRRILAAPVHAAHLLLGGLASMLVVQMIQCYVMYLYAWLAFDVAIWQIAGGLFLLTLCTALATIGFGLLLGALCKTTERLDPIGTMVIMAMSAVGGSMVPRHIMPDWMQRLGLLTINGWSFDGFMSVLAFEGWRGLAPTCGVLLAVAGASATLGSILLARRLRTGTD